MAKRRSRKRKLVRARRPVRRVHHRRRRRRASKGMFGKGSGLLLLVGAGVAAWFIASRAAAGEGEGVTSTPLPPAVVTPEIVGQG